MAEEQNATRKPITIKKYANRRLYHTGTSTYVTLDDLASMVKAGEEFAVFDAKTGEDITRSVLTQIIFEQEGKSGQNLLPVSFLRQLISYYGDSMQALVPSYLEYSIQTLAQNQQKFRDQMQSTFGTDVIQAMEDQVQKNMGMFRDALKMFTPFGLAGAGTATAQAPQDKGDIDALKQQLDEMQKRLDKLSHS